MERDFVDYANAAGSVATALTLFYLVIKEWKTRKHITDLGVIAKELQVQNTLVKDQMKISVKPKLKIPEIIFDSPVIYITIENGGGDIKITSISYSKDNVSFEHNYITEIPNKDKIVLKGTTSGNININKLSYYFILHFTDVYNNKYVTNFIAEGNNIIYFGTSEEE
jgi:hypothetical protein